MDNKKKNQARLRLVKSENLDLCNSCSFTAASPFGSEVRPVSISLTEEGSRPTSPPISLSVIPVDRRSVMRDAQVLMPSNIRHTVELSQRLPVTGFRNNGNMPKHPGMPGRGSPIGHRVRFWRKIRGKSLKELAEIVGYSVSALSDLENDRSHKSEKLHLIAAALNLNPHYLEHGDGEPEGTHPQEPPPKAEEWPFPEVPPSRIRKYGKIERSYLQTELIRAMNEIESERRNKPG